MDYRLHHNRLDPASKRLAGGLHRGSPQVKYIIGVVIAIAIALAVIAIVPDKDCAGNNTWKTAEVCHNGK